jgi:alkylation response protein AidB-like acyl-CoA dehydrogenase
VNILSAERAVLDRVLPGFDKWLAGLGMSGAEDPANEVIEEFRKAGGGNAMIPNSFGGGGLSCLEGALFLRALGSRAPALAVASTMHHYKVAWLAEVLESDQNGIVKRIVSERYLVASCGAEGRSGKQLFAPGIEVSPAEGGLRISGTKRPCSLVKSMGMLTLLAPGPHGSPYAGELLIVMIPATTPGLTWEPLWGNRVLRAAQTDAVILEDVYVPDHMVVSMGDPDKSASKLNSLMLRFLPLITAAYLGIASGQVERLFIEKRGAASDRLAAFGALEVASAAVETIAREVDSGRHDEALLGRMLLVRYAAQRAIAEATDRALELFGGMSFASGGQEVDLLASSRALAFHPPAENAMRERMDAWLGGEGLALV